VWGKKLKMSSSYLEYNIAIQGPTYIWRKERRHGKEEKYGEEIKMNLENGKYVSFLHI
jgi:hypothetical protein